MKKILATLLAVSLTFGSAALPAAESGVFLKGVTISASAETYGDYEYDVLDDGTVEITGYIGDGGDVVIPSEINGKSVTSIGFGAFNTCTNLTSIALPTGVTSIGNSAFECCENLTSITIPNSVTSIGSGTFSGCTSLTSITIPNSVTSIGGGAFNTCTSLTSITIPDSVTSIGENAFYSCGSLVSIKLPNGVTSIADNTFAECSNLTNVTIPDSVTNICESAFERCDNLTSVTIPNSVTKIGANAFCNCTKLKNIVIPYSITEFGGNAFYGTAWFENKQKQNPLVVVNDILIDGSSAEGDIVIPDGVVKIANSAFSSCYDLKSVTIPNSVTSIGNSAFSNCKSLTSITIPNSVTSIGESAFSDCTSLTSITIPNCVTRIGNEAFYKCTSLTSITIPNCVTSIGDWAFEDCTSLTSITIPNSVTSIGESAFYNCTSLTSITIPNSVTSIGNYVFYGTSWLKAQQEKNPLVIVNGILIDGTAASGNVVIPNSVTSIGDYAFEDCTSLTSITISNSVTSIGNDAFQNCTSLKSITIPNSVTSIGYDAFYDTPWLKAQQEKNPLVIVNGILIDGTAASGNVVIPNSVTSIGDYAFSDCTSLTSITIPDSVTSIGDSAFRYCESLTSITIPNSVTSIGDWAFEDCTSLTSITIPNSVTSIGESAFYNCTSLTSITIPNSVTSIGSAAFSWCISLTDVYYTGSETEWNNIDIGENNTYLTNATIHYNYGSIHTHSYTSKITKAATCIATGVKTYTCSCGDTYTETIPATGHKSSGWITDKAASIGVKGSKHKECTVCKKVLETAEIPALSRISISKAIVTLSTSTYAYDGKSKKPGVTVKLNGKTLKNGTDYTVSYSNNTKVGTAKVTITGKGNFTGSVSKTYSIKNDFKKATISGISTKAFTGKNITQSIIVKYNGKTLKNGTDYTVSYSSNKNIGTATVKIAGKSSYTGTITKTFKINPAKQEIQKLTAKSKAFFVDWAQKGSATGYEIQYATNSKFTSAKKVTITNNKTDTKTISKLSGKKKYYVRVRSYTTVKGTKYYGAWSATKTVTTKK